MKKLLGLILAVLAVFTLGACNGKTTTTNTTTLDDNKFVPTSVDVSKVNFVNPGKLTVAVSTDYAPLEFLDLTKKGQEQFVGADIEFAKVLAQAFGVELYIKSMDFDSTMVAVDNGICDIAISGFSWTAERAASYLFTDCYYTEGDAGQVVIVRKEDDAKYNTLADLNKEDVKVAAQSGSLQAELVKAQLGDATFVEIPDLNATYDSLSQGNIDAVASAQSVALTLVSKYPNKYVIVEEAFDIIDEGNYAIVKKNNQALADAVNLVIAQLEEDTFANWVKDAEALFLGLGENAGESIQPEE